MILITKRKYNLIKKCNEGIEVQKKYFDADYDDPSEENWNLIRKYHKRRSEILNYLNYHGYKIKYTDDDGFNFKEIKRKLINNK